MLLGHIKHINVNEERIYAFLEYVRSHLLSVDKESLIVEVGCGSGLLASEIHAVHKNISLIDIVDSREYCRELDFHGVDLSREKLPFEDNSVSIIIATQVLEHIENLTFYINECHRVLKENGRLIVSYPNYSNFMQRMQFLLRGYVGRLGGQVSSGGHINMLPFKSFRHWAGSKFAYENIEGDFMASTVYLPKLIDFLTGKESGRHVVFTRIRTHLLTYNIMMTFSKRRGKD